MTILRTLWGGGAVAARPVRTGLARPLAALALLTLAPAGAALAQAPAATFAALATFSTGASSQPRGIAVADVNGDGKPDLLTANYSSSTAGVLLGTGTGSFGAVTTFSTGAGSGPFSIAVADVNGDGRPDLLTANYGSNTAGVLLGTGTGSFGAVTTFSTGAGSRPTGIAVADVNGDGRPDLLTANYSSSTAGVLLGTGTGSFGAVTTFSTGAGSGPFSIAVADVNGDGRPDLLTANADNNTAGVLLGTGTGSFGAVTPFSTGAGSWPTGIAVADVNGDGRPDLLTANYSSSSTAGVLLGTGTGSFGAVTTFSTGAGSGPLSIAVADVNGDGRPDLLTANYGSNTAGVLLGTGTGSFGAVTPFSTGAGSRPVGIAVADVNGDGKPDLLTANSGSSTAGVLLNTTPVAAPRSFLPVATFSTGASSQPRGIAVADVNGDGKPDLLTANYSSSTAGVLLGTGTGSFGAVTTFSTGAGIGPFSIAVADVNGDGRPDLLTANYSNSTAGVLLGTGTGSFGAVTPFSTGAGSGPFSIAVADVNGDGRPDLLTANADNNTAGVLLGTGTGSFGAVTTFSTGAGSRPTGIAVADVNGDGRPDLLTANYSSSTAGVLLGTGTGSFGAVTTFSTGAGSGPFSIAVADVNGDGRPDLLTANYGSNTAGVLLGTGTGSFGAVTTFSTGAGSRPTGIAVADVNGDGRPDLLTANYSSSTAGVLLGTGTGSFGAVTTFSTGAGSGPLSIAVADVNGDGRPDLLTANNTTNAAGVLLGTVLVAPAITSLNPTSGPVGTGVTITGTDLGNATGLTLNGAAVPLANITANTATGLTFTVPAGASSGTITVTTANGTSAASSQSFTVTVPPALSGAANTTVARGGLVTLQGTGLAGATGVTFANTTFGNTTLNTFTSNTATALAFTLPLAAPYGNVAYNVTVTNANGTSAPFVLTLTDNIGWTGTTSTAWATATNWSPPAVPNTYLNTAVVAAALVQPTVTGIQLVQSVTVGDGGVLTLAPAAGLTTTQNVLLNGGSVLVQGAASELYLGTDLTNYGATFALDPSSEVGFGGGPLSHTINGTAAVPFQVLTVGERNLSGTGDALHLAVPVSVARKLALSHQSTVDVNAGTPGSLTLLSTPAATALVVQDATSSVLCTATVQRALALANPGLGYRHYSSPVSGNALGDLATATFTPIFSSAYNNSTTALPAAGFPTVFGYDQSRLATAASPYTGFDRGWFSPTAATPFAPGTGYAVNLAGTELVDFVGVPRTGNLALTLPRATGSTGGEGLHLVGNPYPAPIDWSLVNATTDRLGLDAAFYVFESSSQYGGSYRSAVNGVGSSNYIGLGQGFFVRVTAGRTSGTLTFKNTHRLTDETLNVPVHRGAADVRPLVQLALAGNGNTDALYLYAEAGATPGTDAAFDAVKLANPSGLNLATLAATGEALAIDGRPAFATAQRVALQVAVPSTGTYTLTAAALANLPATTAVTLTDALTGTTTDLRRTAGYAFTAVATAPAVGRFFLNLTPAGTALATNAAALAAQAQVYPNPTHDAFTLLLPPVAGATQATVTLLNALGQTVSTQTLTLTAGGATARYTTAGLAAGVYALRLSAGKETATLRVVVE